MKSSSKHHLVSRGYQKNFADSELRLVVLEPRSGNVISRRRSIKSNWTEKGWNSTTDENGLTNSDLEDVFSKIESTALDHIRSVGNGPITPLQESAIIELFALHLARSRPLQKWSAELFDEAREPVCEEFEDDEEVRDMYLSQYGSLPRAGELEALATSQLIKDEQSGRLRIDATIANFSLVADCFKKLFVQVVTFDEGLPGLPIGDVPIVLANLKAARYGYRDRVGLNEADLVCAPLSRRCLVSLTRQPTPRRSVTTKSELKKLSEYL